MAKEPGFNSEWEQEFRVFSQQCPVSEAHQRSVHLGISGVKAQAVNVTTNLQLLSKNKAQ
jgi:hypothetical protein